MWRTLEKNCSAERLGRYLGKVAEDELAAEFLYVANNRISESLYPMLSVLEVSLRNCVHNKLSEKYGRGEWWSAEELRGAHHFQSSLEKIDRARHKLYMRGAAESRANVKVVQVVAEVSLGFWTDLFSEDLSTLLGSDLLSGFAHIPSEHKKRRKVGKPLTNIKNLRNRVMHHEPILFDESVPPSMLHEQGCALISWISPEMRAWLARMDRFAGVWGEYQAVRDELNGWLVLRQNLKVARVEGRNLPPYYRAIEAQKKKFDTLAQRYLGIEVLGVGASDRDAESKTAQVLGAT